MKVVNITYFVHSTSLDNEAGIASGWLDVELSQLGIRQAKELKEAVKDREFDVVYCSDLKRAIDTAETAFGEMGIEIIQDKRLRECNYGDYTRRPSEEVEATTLEHIYNPFPNGESYKDVEKRTKSFLDDLLKTYAGKHVAIVSHKVPQLASEVILNRKTWGYAIADDWRLKEPKEWQPGWEYKLEG